MRETLTLNFQEFISAEGEKLTTTSLKVAAVHRKRHDDLVRLIRKRIAEAGEWGVRNFTDTPYIDSQNGQTYSMFTMTRAGYQFLVGKMTGERAVRHQIAFIEAFDAMEAYMKNQRNGLSYRQALHELKCIDSSRRGSFHGRGLNERKQEIPALAAEGMSLLHESQPGLFLN